MTAINVYHQKTKLTSAALLLGWSLCTFGATKVAVLEFELNDLSLLPASSNEQQRTGSLGPMLRETLSNLGGYMMISVAPDSQQRASAGAGYLSSHHDTAANLGRQFGADWVVVGRLQKSNDLFAYLTVQLIDVHAQQRVGEFYTEIKGPIRNATLTQRGVQRIAGQIDTAIKRRVATRPE